MSAPLCLLSFGEKERAVLITTSDRELIHEFFGEKFIYLRAFGEEEAFMDSVKWFNSWIIYKLNEASGKKINVGEQLRWIIVPRTFRFVLYRGSNRFL